MGGSEKSILKKSILACFIILSTLAATTTGEIAFTSPSAGSIFRPGDSVLLTWTIRPAPTTGTVPANTNPFDLQLRAETKQRYNIQANVSQALMALQVQIPADVTGGNHSFYADYTQVVLGQKNGESSRQFWIPLPIEVATSAPPSTGTSNGGVALPTDPATSPPTESSGGLSAGALGGIIGGVIVVLMAVAMCFLCRHRRRVAEDRKDSTSRSMDGKGGHSKEGGGQHQDKESLTKSAGSAGGIPDMRSEGQEAVPLKLNRPIDGSPRSQHQQYQNQHQHHQQQQNQNQRPLSPTATRNPFEAPEMMIHPNSPNGAPSPRQHNNQNHQYQPPQLPPPQQSPFGTPPQQYSGMPPNPLMGGGQQQPGGPGQRNQSPYHQNNRDSFESELESAYDPHPRMMNPPINRNNGSSPMNNGSASPLGYSSSTGSSRYPHNMSPQPSPGSPLNQQAHQDREILAVAAAVAAAASPVPAHRQVQNQKAGVSPRMKEIEMQQFDIQQHHQEQQQKMLQRQQQQQQQRNAQSTPTPMPAAQKSMNPTQFDDKAEFSDSDSEDDEQHQNPAAAALVHPPPPPTPAVPVVEDGPVYNGYRDTIFGAYAHTQDDDDEDEDNSTSNPVPALPPVSAVIASPLINTTASTTYQSPPGGAEIVRKKSVKFTGVPKSGPIVLPNNEAAKEHQQQRQQIKQQQNQTQQGQEEEDSDEFYSQDDEEIRARMLETAESVSSPSASNASASFNKPTVNTTGAPVNGNNSVLSPIRSPGQQQQQQYSNNPYQLGEDEDSTDDEDYMNDPYGAYTTPMPPPQAPYAQQQHHPGVE
ncbi:hypothetical protein BG015_008591, partial [Linnemannia schmuckeri]